jgi:alanine dehydrogenase
LSGAGEVVEALIRSLAPMEQLSLGVFAGSRKEHERRLPIHPWQVHDVDADLRRRIFLEPGYGERFGLADEDLTPLAGGLRSREQLLDDCDVLLLPKPTADDLAEMREGQVLCGWMHAVQDQAITQLAIDRRLTLIAWEAMNHWTNDGSFGLHVFHKNNELAGYCSVLHAMQLMGTTGEYGRRLRAAVIGFGATGRGAVTGLAALGVQDVSVLTRRESAAVAAPIHSVRLITFARDPDHPGQTLELDSQHESVAEFLAEHDIVVNCTMQDTDAPLTFVMNDELRLFRPRTLFVDVSADTGMGFEWSRPTTFTDPMFTLGDGLHCYAVDHSPSLLWNSATWEISEAFVPHLRTVMGGPRAWDGDEIIRPAIEIRDGAIQNPKILSFQGRSATFPHPRA